MLTCFFKEKYPYSHSQEIYLVSRIAIEHQYKRLESQLLYIPSVALDVQHLGVKRAKVDHV